jgi:hypothetical protein
VGLKLSIDWRERHRQVLAAGPYPCPCCGYLTSSQPGSYDTCPVCAWEDDLAQLRFVERSGANHVSLLEGQQNFVCIGVSDERFSDRERAPRSTYARDPLWRPFEPQRDNPERPVSGVNYGMTYPADSTELYYWRPTYWRRNLG